MAVKVKTKTKEKANKRFQEQSQDTIFSDGKYVYDMATGEKVPVSKMKTLSRFKGKK